MCNTDISTSSQTEPERHWLRIGAQAVFKAAVFIALTLGVQSLGLAQEQEALWSVKPNPSWLVLQSMEMPTAEPVALKIWGLVDVVYSADASDQANNTFSLRRVLLGVRGSLTQDQNVDYFVLGDFGTGVVGRDSPLLLDASITLKHIPYLKVRAGQFKLPFGLEGLEAHHTPPLINFTRAAVQLMSFVAPLGLPNRVASNSAFRDIGVQFFDRLGDEKRGGEVVYALASFNGNGINTTDDNNQKDAVARLEFATAGFRLGLSGLTGKETANRLDKGRLGIDASYNVGPLHLGGEVIWARDSLLVGGRQEAYGWHVRASYFINPHLQPVFRYEWFDPNTDVSGNRFDAVALGINWVFKGYTRLQLNYEFRDDQANPGIRDLLTAQAQVLF